MPSAGPAPDDDPLIGTVLLERVRIDGVLARGGMGKVYRGELVRMQRPCAVKVLDPRHAGGDEVDDFTRRFLLEASTAAKLTHPNVVTIFDYGETADGRCFIAMELLEGRSLADELKVSGAMPAERAIHIARQVARALREAHALGVVHRDMKPANVFLLKRDDDDDFAKVLDFGLVKSTAGGDGDLHTQIGRIMGSPRYMAPEQVQGKPVDARTDIYSLGTMLYAMLAGRPPFDKPNDIATLMAQVAEAPRPIASVAAGVSLPPGLEDVVLRCLAKKPEQRYASMQELIAALKLQPGLGTTISESGEREVAPAAAAPPEAEAAPAIYAAPLDVAAAPASPRRQATPLLLAAAVALALGVLALLARQGGAPAAAEPTTVVSSSPVPAPPVAGPSAAADPGVRRTATLHLETDPPGAKVKEDGETVCEATPCDVAYSGDQADPGYEHLLSFFKADYRLERKIAKVGASPLSVKLSHAR